MNTCPAGRLFASEAAAASAKPGATVRPHDDHFHATHDLQAGQGLSRTPFRQAPHEPSQRAVTLQRTGSLRYRSAKTAAKYVSRRQIVAEMFAEPEVCEVPWCTETATDPHEPLTRARGGDILDRDNIRKVCHPHNVMFASDEQPWIYELGFLVHSWDRGAS